jgi:isochorismate pyruvate lyase
MPKPEECQTKQEIRSEIDRLDRQLIALLAERFAYVRRMAELKQGPDEALVQHRVDEVLDKVAREAEERGLDSGLARDLWQRLIDWNVEYERRAIGERKRGE